ncbi:hypothetical protein DFH07DRAFT_970900 [Mycena maculata]|uniref:DUF6593 domain-containing protein n=1 Tax=Mycena maculata TaxID=230809 RepID=A0AAD7HPE6_9AGAR|nr:hypothetical protein DFH07DRAFT_970900 [Mycena maculata]
MHLFLNTDSPWNTFYTDESGALQYKTNTPLKLHDRTTTISRVVEGIPRADGREAEAEVEDGARFASLAQINWRQIESSVIHFQGRELATQEFFRTEGSLGWFGRPRAFTALDGKQYKWILGAFTSEASLKLNDGSETMVAQYHHKKFVYGMFSKPQKPSLEIAPPFEHMADEILVTFVYIEQLRKSKDGSQSIVD